MPSSAAANARYSDRLAKLRELVILYSEPEAVFDSIVRMATEACGVPIALISLIDAERQWFKANVGLPRLSETPRDIAFCDYAICSDEVFEITDTRRDSRFNANPLVTADPNIRFYAGAPLVMPGGERVGTLCVLDRVVNKLTEAQMSTLRALAEIVSQTLIMRRDLINKTLAVRDSQDRAHVQSERFMRQIADSLPIRIAYVDPALRYRFVNQAQCDRFGLTRFQILGQARPELKNGVVDVILEARARAALNGEAQKFQFEDPTSTGLRSIEGTMIPDVLTNGDVVGFSYTGVDVTERVAAERALSELTAIIENTTDFVTQIDRHGQVTYMNPASRRASGIDLDAPVGELNYATFNTPRTLQLHVDVILPALQSSGVWVGETTVYGANRQEIPVSHMVIAHRDERGRVERYSAVMRDITVDTNDKLDALRQINTLRSVTEAIPESVAVVGSDLRYRFVNSAFECSLDLPREKIIGMTMRYVLGRDAFLQNLPRLARALAGETVAFESMSSGVNGPIHLSISHAPLRVDQAGVDSVVTVSRDITLQKREEKQLRELSRRDGLSGLLNRAGQEQYLERALSEGGGASLALLYIDLDHFKPVNDQHGHAVGDQVLQLFAQRMRKSVRPTDCVARLGGDEFVIVLADVADRAVVWSVAEQVINAAKRPFAVGEHHISAGASVGIARGVVRESGWRDLIARADANLYKAKAAGRGRYVDEAPDEP